MVRISGSSGLACTAATSASQDSTGFPIRETTRSPGEAGALRRAAAHYLANHGIEWRTVQPQPDALERVGLHIVRRKRAQVEQYVAHILFVDDFQAQRNPLQRRLQNPPAQLLPRSTSSPPRPRARCRMRARQRAASSRRAVHPAPGVPPAARLREKPAQRRDGEQKLASVPRPRRRTARALWRLNARCASAASTGPSRSSSILT